METPTPTSIAEFKKRIAEACTYDPNDALHCRMRRALAVLIVDKDRQLNPVIPTSPYKF